MKRKQIVFTGIGKAELLDTEYSAPVKDEVLVKTEYSVISAGTERANLVAEPNTASGGKFPWKEGYCSVGVVVDVGSDVKNRKAGDRVLVYHGCHAEYNKIKEARTTLVHPDIDPLDAAPIIIAAMGLGGLRKLEPELGESCMIFGLGLLGIYSVQFARQSGAMPLIVADLNPERRKIALETGADFALDPTEPDFIKKVMEITGGKGVKNIIEVTGKAIALNQALECASYMAKISLLGCTRIPEGSINFYQQVHRPGVQLIGAHNMVRPLHDSFRGCWTMHDDCANILDMIRYGRVTSKPIITDVLTPYDAPMIYDRLANDKNFPLGVVFDWSKL